VPVPPVVAVVALAVLANLVLMAALALPAVLSHREGDDGGQANESARAAAADLGPGGVAGEGFDRGTVFVYERVVRIVSWIFILSATSLVAATGLWAANQTAIIVLLSLAGLALLLAHELLPTTTLGTAKFVVEGSLALTLASLLVLLTGQEESPFFIAFPLIVTGAALLVRPGITVALTVVAALAYLAAVLIPVDGHLPTAAGLVRVAVNLAALVLLAYVILAVAREQRRSREAAIVASTVDSLTGLFNRNYFFAALEREIARSSRSGRGFCLVMADLDGLKEINDRYGHFYGDRVLREVGEVIRQGVRRVDTPARYGGDEFVILLPETDPTGAWVVAEKIRLGAARLTVDGPGFSVRTSLSVGVVAYPNDGRTADELMISADEAMYASKRGGRDRVTTAPGASGGGGTGPGGVWR
jgi:diguanylate cyclase (GGDEF)-like protein